MADETGEQIGTARIDIIADTATFDAEVKRAKNLISGLGPEGEKSFAKMTQAQKRATVAALKFEQGIGKTREEVRLLSLAAKGAAPEALERVRQKLLQTRTAADSANTALGAQTKAFSGSAKSAREIQFAMRTLPAQFTDIATAIGSGQRPLTILLQQGGQIKDMFGGIRPALAAVGSQLLKLINPVTAVAVVVGTLVFAYKQAIDEERAFQKALLTTGNYANTSVSQMQTLEASLVGVGVTYGEARDAVQQVAASGRIAADQFTLVATAAARMQEATGQSIDDTVKKFEQLAGDPVKTLLKLNETEHFLTKAQLDRVQALIDEGKEQDAASEAARIYAGRLDDIAKAADNARPHLASMWRDAKKELSSLWQDTKDYAEYIAAASEKFQQTPWWKRLAPGGAFKAAVGAMFSAEPSAPPVSPSAVPGAVDSKTVEAQQEAQQKWQSIVLGNLTKQQRLQREIVEIRKAGLAAGKSEVEIEKQITAAKAQAATPARHGSGSRLRGSAFDADSYQSKSVASFVDEVNKAGAASDAFRKKWAAAINGVTPGEQRFVDTMAEANAQLKIGAINADEFGRIAQAALLGLNKPAKDATSKLSQFAIQASRNMQDAFAQFLFEPWKGGLDGMLKGFTDMLRKMAAQAAAAKILQAIGGAIGGSKSAQGNGGWAQFLQAIAGAFGGGKAGGGSVSAGTTYLVGENGPELFHPGMNGHITPNHALGATNVNVQVINQGGDLQVTGQQTSRSGGMTSIKVFVKSALSQMSRTGELDPILLPYAQRRGTF